MSGYNPEHLVEKIVFKQTWIIKLCLVLFVAVSSLIPNVTLYNLYFEYTVVKKVQKTVYLGFQLQSIKMDLKICEWYYNMIKV